MPSSTRLRRYSFSDIPSGQSKLGISWPPSAISTSQRSAISSVDSIAPGNSANESTISCVDFK